MNCFGKKSLNMSPSDPRPPPVERKLPDTKFPPMPRCDTSMTSELASFFSWYITHEALLSPSLEEGCGLLSPKFHVLDYLLSYQFILLVHDKADQLLPDQKTFHICVRMNINTASIADYMSRFRFTVRSLMDETRRRDVPVFALCPSTTEFGSRIDATTSSTDHVLHQWLQNRTDDDRSFVEGYQSFSYTFNRDNTETPRYPLVYYDTVCDGQRFFGAQPVIIDCEIVTGMKIPTKLFRIDETNTFNRSEPPRLLGDKNANFTILVGPTHKRILVHREMLPAAWVTKNRLLNCGHLDGVTYEATVAVLRYIYYNLLPAYRPGEMNDILELTNTMEGLARLDHNIENMRAVHEFHVHMDDVAQLIFKTTPRLFLHRFKDDQEFAPDVFQTVVRVRDASATHVMQLRTGLTTNFFVRCFVEGVHTAERARTPDSSSSSSASYSRTLSFSSDYDTQSSPSDVSSHSDAEMGAKHSADNLSSSREQSSEPEEASSCSISSGRMPAGGAGGGLFGAPNVTVGDPALSDAGYPPPAPSRSRSQSTTRSSSLEWDSFHSGPLNEFGDEFDDSMSACVPSLSPDDQPPATAGASSSEASQETVSTSVTTSDEGEASELPIEKPVKEYYI